MIYTLSSPATLVEGGHNAFPGAVRLTSGRIVATYRAGSNHVGGTDGVIRAIHSDDQGVTWSTPVTVLSESGIDLRDPALARLNDGRLAMTLFRYDNGESLGVNVSYSSDGGSTWTAPAALPFGYTDWSACSGPLVETSPGTLMAFAYGEDTGDTLQSVRSLTSTDNGATWGSDTLLLDGPADSITYQEPFAGKLPGGRVMVDVRSDTDATRRRLIRAANGTWSAPSVVSTGVRGRPVWFRSIQGHVIVGDRNVVGRGLVASQDDEEGSLSAWSYLVPVVGVENTNTYQQMVQLDAGVVGILFCYERSSTDSLVCWATYTPDDYTPPPRRGASAAFL